MYTISEFETRLLAMQVDIENISLRSRFVAKVIGYKNNLGYKWDESGKCRRQDKNNTRTPEFDLIF